VFPSVLSLGSTNSAPGRPGLFAGFELYDRRGDEVSFSEIERVGI
jgi:hypothetical protein